MTVQSARMKPENMRSPRPASSFARTAPPARSVPRTVPAAQHAEGAGSGRALEGKCSRATMRRRLRLPAWPVYGPALRSRTRIRTWRRRIRRRRTCGGLESYRNGALKVGRQGRPTNGRIAWPRIPRRRKRKRRTMPASSSGGATSARWTRTDLSPARVWAICCCRRSPRSRTSNQKHNGITFRTSNMILVGRLKPSPSLSLGLDCLLCLDPQAVSPRGFRNSAASGMSLTSEVEFAEDGHHGRRRLCMSAARRVCRERRGMQGVRGVAPNWLSRR
mmetsp:Transcript_149376/g.479719  ORF Transcript_149376/g.479719 Transcript_149376/m.479719 type:complete len:276 (-) Transcript_149376:100-927(-)